MDTLKALLLLQHRVQVISHNNYCAERKIINFLHSFVLTVSMPLLFNLNATNIAKSPTASEHMDSAYRKYHSVSANAKNKKAVYTFKQQWL